MPQKGTYLDTVQIEIKNQNTKRFFFWLAVENSNGNGVFTVTVRFTPLIEKRKQFSFCMLEIAL